MLRKIRRQFNKAKQLRKSTPKHNSYLSFEPLESRLLLDVAGYWSELGYRSASGGGVSWDPTSDVGETQIITSEDGDPVVFWVEGTYQNLITLDASDDPVPYSYSLTGTVHARQFAGEDLGWWDLDTGSGDTAIINGGQIDAVAGPNGKILLTGITNDQVFVMEWDGADWTNISNAGATVNLQTVVTTVPDPQDPDTLIDVTEGIVASKPSIAVNGAGEIFVSYTAEFPGANQREIVVMKYGYAYYDNNVGTPLQSDLGWVELISTEVGQYGQTAGQLTGGASNTTGNSFDSSITIDNTGKPLIAWTEAADEVNAEIFVKRWDGNSWEEIGENSASFNEANGNFGISNNSYQDLHPDIAVNGDGDIIVTWVSWHNWTNYTSDGEAGVYVRYLPGDDLTGAWRGYDFVADGQNVESDSDAGVAQGNDVPTGRAGLGWYYQPELILDSSGNAAITWFGWGESENNAVDRDHERNPYIPDDPYWGVFVSYYYDHDNNSATADTFEILFEDYDEATYEWNYDAAAAHTNVQRAVAGEPDKIAWAPSLTFVGEAGSENLVFSYVQEDEIDYEFQYDQEAYVKYWDGDSWEEYGLGAASNGNPLISDYPVDAYFKTSDIAYFEFNSIATDDYDVVTANADYMLENAGQMYVYDRQTGSWSTSEPLTAGGDDINLIDHDNDGTYGFGRVFDLKGEPEIEYSDIDNGNPLLAFLDDTDGIPYVYQYSIAGGWALVGGVAAGLEGGNFDYDSEDTGISVQMAPDGSILVAYVATNQNGTVGDTSDDYDYVITRLYNPTTNLWSDADTGDLSVASVLEATYFANYNGYDFDEVGDLSDGDYDDDNNRVYETGPWNFWGVEDDEVVTADITSYDDTDRAIGIATGRLHNWFDYTDNDDPYRQAAIEIAFNFAADSTQTFAYGDVDHQFELIDDGDIIIEFDASLDAAGKIDGGTVVDPLQDKDLYLYLTVDGTIVDVNPNDSAINTTYVPSSYTPVAVAAAGELIEMTSFKFDSTELYDIDGDLIDLIGGEHQVGFMAISSNNGGAAVAVEQNGAVRIDNVVVYQRVIAESRFVSGATSTFNDGQYVLGGGTWSYADVATNASADGTIELGLGRSGDADDDVLRMELDNANGTVSGQFKQEYNVTETGYVRLDFDYKIDTNTGFGASDVVELLVWADFDNDGVMDIADGEQLNYDSANTETLSAYIITGPDGDSEWVRVSLTASVTDTDTDGCDIFFTGKTTDGGGSDVGTATIYIDNVDVSHSLTLDTAADIDLTDADSSTNASNWIYSEADVGGLVSAGMAGGADDSIQMTFASGANSNSYGQVGYTISTSTSNYLYYSYLSLDFSYKIELDGEGVSPLILNDGAVDLNDFGAVELYLVEDDGDGILEAATVDTYSRISDEGLYRYYSDGMNDADSGWVEVNDAKIGPLDPSTTYFIVFRGLISDSDIDTNNGSTISIDDVSVKYTGYTQWENDESATGNTGGNNTVGPTNNQGIYRYENVFRGDMHASNVYNQDLGIQSQMITIPDYTQAITGDARISFRYRWSGSPSITTGLPDLSDIRLLIDGVEYDSTNTSRLLGVSYSSSASWYDGMTNNPTYTLVEIDVTDLAVGSHDISIELVGGTDVWVDNLLVQGSTSLIDSINPIVKLGAVGQNGERPFIVGATYIANDMEVYPTEGATISGKYSIRNYIDYDPTGLATQEVFPRNFLADAYTYAALYELNNNNWEQYGDSIMATVGLNFMGVPGASTVNPAANLYYLQDFVTGPSQAQWILVENAETEMVDVTGNGDFSFDAHPWNFTNPPEYWGPPTSLTTEILLWDITDEDDNDREDWVAVTSPMPLFATNDNDDIFRNAQIISGPSQMPIVAWSDYSNASGYYLHNGSHAVRYTGNALDPWEAVGPSADGDIQNGGQSWGATTMHEMIRDENGLPLISYAGGHLDVFAIREFVTDLEDADATIVDMDDIQNDLVLDYGIVDGGRVAERFSITNDGQGDLYVQNLTFGGLGDAQSAFNITNDPGIGTEALILESGETYVFNVEFDPNSVPIGSYQGVIVVQTNEGESDTHPFDNFQEIIVRVEVANEGDIVVEDDQGNRTDRYMFFDDAIINMASSVWQTQVITIRNEGTDTLDISDLVYTGAGFEIVGITKNGSTDLDADDDGQLDSTQTLGIEETIEITVGFNPKESLLYDETIYVVSDDTSEPIVPVRMLGYGLTGGDVTIETSIDGIEWTTVWLSNDSGLLDDVDRALELGSTVWGQTDATPLYVRINNTGSSELLIEEVRLQSGTSEVAFSPDSRISEVEIDTGDSYTFKMTYSPNTGNVQDITTDLLFLSENLFILTDSSDEDDAEISLAVEGYAVPEAPVVQIVDPVTGEIISGWIPEAGVVVDASKGLDMGIINLGTGSIGSNSFTKTFYVRNLGGENLTIEALQVGYISGGDSITDYSITPVNQTGYPADDILVAGGGTDYSVVITFTPTVTGEKTALFYLDYSWDWNGDGVLNNSQVFVELFSDVTDQTMVVSDDDGKSNAILDFSSVGLGHYKDANVIVTNTGASDLTITNWELLVNNGSNWVAAGASDPFSVTAFEDSFAVSGGSSQLIPITFAPVSIGNYDAILRIYSDDASQTDNGDGTYYTDYTLSGMGVAPGVVETYNSTGTTVISSLDFGTVEYGEVWTDGNDFRKYFRVVNDGDAVIDLTRIYADNNLFTLYVDGVVGGLSSFADTDDVTLEPGEYVTVGVAFSGQQPFFDTAVVGLQHVYIDYDDNSGDSGVQALVNLEASVLMTATPDAVSSSSSKVVWSDDDGDLITVVLSGPGSFQIKAVSTTNNDIGVIELSGTTIKSILKITGENAQQYDSVIGAILGENGGAIEELGGIYMKYVDIDGDQGISLTSGQNPADAGDGVADRQYAIAIDTLGSKMILGDIFDQADIYVGSVEKSSGLDLITGEISGGTDIYVDGNIKNFTVAANDTKDRVDVLADSIEVTGSLNSFTVKGYDADVTSDFTVGGNLNKMNLSKAGGFTGKLIVDGDLGTFNMPSGTLTGQVIADNLKKLTVEDMNSGTIAVQSSIKSVKINNNMIDAFILSGVNVGADNAVGGLDDSLVGGSEIKSVTVKGMYSDSNILAGIGENSSGNYDVFGPNIPVDTASGSIGSVKFGYVDFGDTLDEFGIGAGTSIKSLRMSVIEGGSTTTYKSSFSLNLDATVDGDEFFMKLF